LLDRIIGRHAPCSLPRYTTPIAERGHIPQPLFVFALTSFGKSLRIFCLYRIQPLVEARFSDRRRNGSLNVRMSRRTQATMCGSAAADIDLAVGRLPLFVDVETGKIGGLALLPQLWQFRRDIPRILG